VILRSNVAIVTGARRGLGRAYALAPSDAGAHVVVHDLDSDVAASVVEEILGSSLQHDLGAPPPDMAPMEEVAAR
jgi:NAD(P)-dependent dehydrogenase (short-subunit alcohol dehydrogenase family)